jgi:hypothetical protein
MNEERLTALQPHHQCERVRIPSQRFARNIPPVLKEQNDLLYKAA